VRIALWHNLPSGGAKRALYEQVKGLQRRGHRIESWCPSSADGDYLPLSDLVTEHVIPFDWQDPPSKGRVENLLYPYRSVQSQLAAMERVCSVCADQITAGGFDVLFSNSCRYFRAPPVGRMVGRLPKVLYAQEPYRWLYEALPALPWVLGGPTSASQPLRPRNSRSALRDWIRLQGLRLQAHEERANAAGFDRILVNSLFSRESVIRTYGLDADVCYLGIATEIFRPTGDARERFVISVGSETFEKGVDTAIHAIASIAKERRPPLVWVANIISPAHHEKMQALAHALDVAFDVRTRVTDTELVSLLNRSAVMIYVPRLEPFGLAPLEASACGTPVVAVAEGGIRESLTHMESALLIPGRDPVALGRAVLSLLDNPELAIRLGERGREAVRTNWTWDAAIDRLEGYLQSTAAAVAAR